MELEELKYLWKQKTVYQPKDEAQIALMLRGSSKSLIDKLKRSVWFELLFTLLAGIALLIYALNLPSGSLKWTSVSILVIFVAYTFYYIKKLSLLNRFAILDQNLKENIEKLITSLSSYLKFYKRSYTLLYPVYFFLGILFGGLELGSDRFFERLSEPRVIAFLLATALLFFFISTWFTSWYLRKLYGNHLEKLKGIYRELESENA
jgi:hypothetical protein